jgi:hypothetical protein
MGETIPGADGIRMSEKGVNPRPAKLSEQYKICEGPKISDKETTC